MFIDTARVVIASGDGGHGCISFRREKYVPAGGPDGGDGGRGGNVVFHADPNINTLDALRHKKKYAADNGENGRGKKMSGKSGEDLRLAVPVGTLVRLGWDVDDTGRPSGRILADLSTPHEPQRLLAGGRGGRGNQHFATAVRQAPKFSEDGKPGRSLQITLELKVIADVGIIGLPNAGKSTLLAALTSARPKIGDYKFTTLHPNLGVHRVDYGREVVFADIPGLIEGASTGAGLGYAFLRHIERTRVLLHVVDAAPIEGTPADAIRLINAELATYNPILAKRPQIIIANKADLSPDAAHLEALEALAREHDWPLVQISAAAHMGLGPLITEVLRALETAPPPEDPIPAFDESLLTQEPEDWIRIEKESEGRYTVEGPGIERLLGYTNMTDERGFAFFQRFLREKGIIERLEALGIQDNDTVALYEMEFDYWK